MINRAYLVFDLLWLYLPTSQVNIIIDILFSNSTTSSPMVTCHQHVSYNDHIFTFEIPLGRNVFFDLLDTCSLSFHGLQHELNELLGLKAYEIWYIEQAGSNLSAQLTLCRTTKWKEASEQCVKNDT